MSCFMPTEHTTSNLVISAAARSSCLFLIDHPLDVLKFTWQKFPNHTGAQVIGKIVQERGLFGFSDTMLANFPRRIGKEIARWLGIAYTHEQLIGTFPETFTREAVKTKIATGISTAALDCFIILPLEQLMAYRVKEQKGYSAFFQKRFVQDGIPSLYRGLSVNLLRQTLMWSSLMTINCESKRVFDLIDKERLHPFLRQEVASVLFSTAYVTFGLPIDFIKTRIQMDTDLQKIKVSSVVRTLVQRHKFSGFYAGALPVFTQTMIQMTLGGYILDEIFDPQKPGVKNTD
ncbi:MAG TPA: hypothetical protein DCE71_04715 [Parachlamydiales bacterium]|nr:hypothetical protein [Parachlamydiales bacterium]